MAGHLWKHKITLTGVLLACALALIVNHVGTRAGTPAASAVEKKEPLPATVQVKEIAGYKSWTKVNAEPLLMPEQVATACAVMVSPSGAVVYSGTNPHRDKYFTVYVNDIGRRAMLEQRKPDFPQGSVIVKEKLSAADSSSPELMTVMIKQKKGFNPSSGDWEYMVVDGTGTKTEGRGALENCQGCHLGHRKSDYVFRTYLPYEMRGRLK